MKVIQTKLITRDSKETIYLLRGLPGSGKTTWAYNNLEQLNAVRVNRDDIRSMLGRGYSTDLESDIVKPCVTDFVCQIIFGSDFNNVVVDSVNLKESDLQEWRENAIDWEVNLIEVFFNVPVETCIEQDSARENPVGKEVILKFKDLYEQAKEEISSRS